MRRAQQNALAVSKSDVVNSRLVSICSPMRPRVLFVSLCDARDPNADSGYSYSMRSELKRHFDVVDHFPLILPGDRFWLAIRAAYKAVGLYYYPIRETVVLKAFARSIERAIAATKPQIVFATSSIPVSLVETSVPLMYVTDQLFCDFVENYIDRPSARFRRLGNAQEALALAAAARVSYPSEWAARSAVRQYGEDYAKIDVIPWGANLPQDIAEDDVAAAISARRLDQCHLVSIGRDWRRKGGDTLVATVNELNRMGLKTHATIIGCDPRGLPADRFTIHPFLDKQRPDQFSLFVSIMLNASFLFLPSRAEAFGQAFCEATAFGLPAIGSTVGGIPIRDGETGYLRPANDTAEQFAELIFKTLKSPLSYREMAHEARRDHRQRLNWHQFGERMSRSIATLF